MHSIYISSFYIIFFQAPRTEAVSIIGSLLSLPVAMIKLPMLQPNGPDIVTMTCPEAKVILLLHIILITIDNFKLILVILCLF